jgi:hypothetical protein
VRWARQQRLLIKSLFRDQRPTVAVGRDDEGSGHVIADQRDRRRVAAVAHRQGAPSAGGILGIGERRLRAEDDVRQVDAAARESLRWPERDTAPVRDRRIDDLNIPLAVRLGRMLSTVRCRFLPATGSVALTGLPAESAIEAPPVSIKLFTVRSGVFWPLATT